MKAVAFDPGGTTGVATLHLHDDGIIKTDGWQVKTTFEVYSLLESAKWDQVIYESFRYERRGNVNLKPVEVIGVIKLACEMKGLPLVPQTPSTGKGWWYKKLETVGLWTPKMPHANDAMAHLLHWFTFTFGNDYFAQVFTRIHKDFT